MGVWTTPRCTRDVKKCTYCCYVYPVTQIVRVRGMPWPETSATYSNDWLSVEEKSQSNYVLRYQRHEFS